MKTHSKILHVSLLTLATVLHGPAASPALAAPKPDEVGAFEVQFDEGCFPEGFSGDLLIAFAQRGEPRAAMHAWVDAPPVLRFSVKDIEPGHKAQFSPGEATANYPGDWSTVEAGTWQVQAIARCSQVGRRAGQDLDDVYSAVAKVDYRVDAEGSVTLRLNQVVHEVEALEETERIKCFEMVSPLLSEFHGFDYTLRAGVRLPADYEEGELYPVVYDVTGFGGTHRSILRGGGEDGGVLDRCIHVVPDASNRYGHSVFCNSLSIGPWGDALVLELIPALEKRFGGAGPEHRYTTGVSSGGWSSLWLQVAYPEAFAGCWSHAPDPIDFHDFQQINLYEPLPDGKPRNMYVDEEGNRRPLARRGGQVMLFYEDFVRHEHVTNPGGQIRSFEATFSPPAADGTPRRVFDVKTGYIDHEAAQTWRPYDISHILLTQWDDLRPRLEGKIHIYAGEVDTFYLEGAVERFQALAEEQGLLSDMVVEVIEGMPHTRYPAGHQHMLETIERRWQEREDGEE